MVLQQKMESMIGRLKEFERMKEDARRLMRMREYYLRYVSEERFREDWLWRLLIDFCARQGYTETVNALVERLKGREFRFPDGADCPEDLANRVMSFQELVSLEVYDAERDVVDALKAHKCKPALEWCEQNRSLLKKISSPLEFELHLQEFVELVRKDKQLKAIEYAKQHFGNMHSADMHKIKQAMGSMAFGPNTKIEPYASLYDRLRWDKLVHEFRRSNRSIHALTEHPELLVHLQAGICALKSPPSFESDNIDDPLHHPSMKSLSRGLPYAFHDQSILRCAWSGELMNDQNPPMALPNGNVYGLRTVEAQTHNGKVRDPRSQEEFALGEVQKCFVMN